MRTFGVEEELLLVDASTLLPVAFGPAMVERHGGWTSEGEAHDATGPTLTTELQQEQIEIVGPPRTTLAEQLESIRLGRRLADEAARTLGARVVALASPVSPHPPHLTDTPRYRRLREGFGLLAAEDLTCGFHVHVGVESREEGIQVLDRIRVWLPVLLAMSANSPFWFGRDSEFSSYRYQMWSRWPTAGCTDVFGSVEEYDRQVEALLRSGAALDNGMIYFDARLSSRFPTVEVRIADICPDPRQAAVIAALARALVETAARQWRDGVAPPPVRSGELRGWTWRAAWSGLGETLVSPASGELRPSGEVVAALFDLVRPVLAEYGEEEPVDAVVAQLLRDGTGSRIQRDAYAGRQDVRDVVDAVLQLTHRQDAPPGLD